MVGKFSFLDALSGAGRTQDVDPGKIPSIGNYCPLLRGSFEFRGPFQSRPVVFEYSHVYVYVHVHVHTDTRTLSNDRCRMKVLCADRPGLGLEGGEEHERKEASDKTGENLSREPSKLFHRSISNFQFIIHECSTL